MILNKSRVFLLLFAVAILVGTGVGIKTYLSDRDKLVSKLQAPDVSAIYNGRPTARDIANWFAGIKCDPPGVLRLGQSEADGLLIVSGTVASLMSMYAEEDGGIDRDSLYWKLMAINWPEIVATYDERYGIDGRISIVNLSIVIGTSMGWASANWRTGL